MLKTLAMHPLVIAAAIIGGIGLGLLAPEQAAGIGVLGQIYGNLLKMVVLPFMVSAIVFSLRQLFEMDNYERYLGRVLVLFLAGVALSAVIGAGAGALLEPGRHLAPETLATFGRMVEQATGPATDLQIPLAAPPPAAEAGVLRSIARETIPDNIFAALAEGNSLKVLVFAILFGIAFGHIPRGIAGSLSLILDGTYRACQNLIKWFNLFLPLALFAMLADQIARTGIAPLLAMTRFVVAFCLVAMLLATACGLGILRRAGIGARDFFVAFRETLLLAVTTGSNTACIPNSIAALVEGLRFHRALVELLVPMGAALLRTGPALYYAMTTVFVAQLYDRPLDAGLWLLLVTGAFVGGLASAGASGLVTIGFAAIAFGYVGLPFEAAFVLFVAVERIVLIPRTLFSVMSTCLVAALVSPRPETKP